MKNCISQKFILNNRLFPRSEFKKILPNNGISIYEVIRIYNGKPLFYEDHYFRLKKSAELTGMSINLNTSEFLSLISKLVRENDTNSGNIRFVINELRNKEIFENNIILSFIQHRYPYQHEIINGVIAHTINASRENPNAKTINIRLRSLLDSIILNRNIYETIMVNEHKLITEGSRSNIFFVKNNNIYTPPVSDVLPGITRQKILNICSVSELTIFEEKLPLNKLSSFDAAFITGTSPGILQLKQVDNFKFITGNEIVKTIFSQYKRMVEDYLSSLDIKNDSTGI